MVLRGTWNNEWLPYCCMVLRGTRNNEWLPYCCVVLRGTRNNEWLPYCCMVVCGTRNNEPNIAGYGAIHYSVYRAEPREKCVGRKAIHYSVCRAVRTKFPTGVINLVPTLLMFSFILRVSRAILVGGLAHLC